MSEPQWVTDAALLVHVAAWFDSYDTEHNIADDQSVQHNLRRIAATITASNAEDL